MSATVIIPTLDPDSDMVARCLEAIGPDVDVEVIHDTNRDGFVATCTRGADQATGDVLVFLNDDTIPQPGWLDAIEAAITDDRIVGGLMVYPDGNIQHSGVFFRRRNGTLEAYNRQTTAPSGEVPAITGACLAITRKRWDDLGGFDAGYLNGYEDVDLCLRHREAGGHVWYAAQCVVVHLESQSPGRFTHAQQNVARLQARWGQLPI